MNHFSVKYLNSYMTNTQSEKLVNRNSLNLYFPTVFKFGSGRTVERRTVNRGDGGSIPPTAVSKLRQFRSPHICPCLSEETLKAGGPFYLVSMPGEVKDPTRG